MDTMVKNVRKILQDSASIPSSWDAEVILQDDNMTYLVKNETTYEAIVVDPTFEDWDILLSKTSQLRHQGYRFIAVFDSHTHADHISVAARLADELSVPYILHEASPSRKVHLRVSRDAVISTAAGPIRLLVTPGHTPDCLTILWGPFVFGGDMILYGDTGRDDLPGGDPVSHYESLLKIKKAVHPEMIFLPGHDGKGGRASSWKTQIEVNPSLTQDRETFIREAGSYRGPSPKQLKESLFENFK